MEANGKRQRRVLTSEYKAEVVALCRSGGKRVGEVARELDLSEAVVRRWIARSESDHGHRAGQFGRRGPGNLSVKAG